MEALVMVQTALPLIQVPDAIYSLIREPLP